MRIRLRDIPPEGLPIAQELSAAWFAQALGDDESMASSATSGGGRGRAELKVTKVEANVFVRGRLEARLGLPCARCLGPAALEIDEAIDLTLAPRESIAGEPEELELSADDLEFGYFENDQIDVGELLRERVLLAIPISLLCREECRGLCTRCGTDLNDGPCDCPEPDIDPRFAKLRSVKLGQPS